MKRKENFKTIQETGVIAILRHIPFMALRQTMNALIKGGVRCVEVTANTADALSMVRFLAQEYSDQLVIGAGTILDSVTAKAFIQAGAGFLLSPSVHQDVIETAREHQVLSIPGAYTPTEIIQGYQWGGDIIKLFPAVTAGVEYIRQIRGPFANIPLLGVGGITVGNTAEYIKAGCMGVGVGSSLVNPGQVERGDFDGICQQALRFCEEVYKGKENFL